MNVGTAQDCSGHRPLPRPWPSVRVSISISFGFRTWALLLAGLAGVQAAGAQWLAAAEHVPLDAGTCSALAAATARGGSNFALSRAGCSVAAGGQAKVGPGGGTGTGSSSSTSTGALGASDAAFAYAQQLQMYAPVAVGAVPPAVRARPPAKPAKPAVGGAARRATATLTSTATSTPGAVAGSRLPAALVRAVQLAPAIDEVAASHGVDPLLLHAIARIESRHNPVAVSHAGARGLMQVMPATAARFGVNSAQQLDDASINLQVSAQYLNTLKRRFPGELKLVLAAYNAGEGAVERHGRRVPPYAETQDYVRKVLHEYAALRDSAARLAALP